MILLTAPATITIAVDGEGLLRFAKAGQLVYASRATLHAANGVVVNESGLPLVPKVSASGTFTVSLDGTISCAGKPAGRIVLAKVANGRATLLNPGEGLAGIIRVTATVTKSTANAASPKGAPTISTTARAATPKPISVRTGGTKATTGRVSIDVHAESQIEGERILLGSIAEIAAPAAIKSRLEALDLGKLPPLGTSRMIGAGYVRALVRGMGLKVDDFDLTVPVGATVARNGVVIETQTILDEATKDVEGFVPSPARAVAPMTVPVGALQLTTSSLSRGAVGATVVVTATVDGKPVGTRTVALVPDPNVPSIKVGETVRLRLISGGATIEVSGKAKTAARQGSEITVVTATGSVHTGLLLPNSLVEVKL